MTTRSGRPGTTDRSVEPARRGLKQERAVRTNAQILDAAAEIFARKGFFEVTLLDIADRAGVTKGAVYFHYTNKEALAVAVSEEYYRRLKALADEVRQLDISPRDAAIELLTRMAVALRDDNVVQAAVRLHSEHFLISGGLPTPFVTYIQLLTELLDRAAAQGELPAGSQPEVLGRVLVASFYGAQHLSWVLQGRRDIVERIQEVIDAVFPSAVQRGGTARSA